MVFTIQNEKEIIMDKILKYILWPILLAPALYLIFIWNSLPDNIVLLTKPIETADRVGNKSELIKRTLIFLALSTGVYFLISNIYRIDRRKYATENKDRLQRMAFAISTYISIISILIIYSSYRGFTHFDVRLVFGSIGLIWCIFGNYMYTLKPNSFTGIRNRWTLNNKENWRKTHRFAGKLWFITGLLLAMICILSPQPVAVIAFVIVSVSIGLLPFIYSYYLYKFQTTSNE